MKLTRQKTSPSVARRIQDNLTLLWQRIRITWRSEDYPAWMMSLPNPLPRGWKPIWPRQRANKRMSRRARSILWDQHGPPF
jgi:hypothetical protein